MNNGHAVGLLRIYPVATQLRRDTVLPAPPTQSPLPLSAHLDTLHAHELLTSQVLDLILSFIQNSLQKAHIVSRLKEPQTKADGQAQHFQCDCLLSQA